jgi:hypothetical protein
MPLYKDLWYADTDSPLSPHGISAAEATSAGNKLEFIEKALPVKVISSAARNELYPTPVQGDSVYRLDLGWEERYYEVYNFLNNIGGKPEPGWYQVNSGPKNILATEQGGFAFRIFTNLFTSDYSFWKISYNLSTTTATTLDFAFTDNSGNVITTPQYYFTRIATNLAGTTSLTSASNTLFPLGIPGLTNGFIHSGEITLSDVATGNYPKFMHSGYQDLVASRAPIIGMTHGYYNSASASIGGFIIYTRDGNDLQDGTGSTPLLGSLINIVGYN